MQKTETLSIKDVKKEVSDFLGDPKKKKKFFRLWYAQKKVYNLQFNVGSNNQPPNEALEINVVRKCLLTVFQRKVALMDKMDEQNWQIWVSFFSYPENLKWIIKRYQKSFDKYYHRQVKKSLGRVPIIGKSEACFEFLRRGFVHQDTFPVDKGKWVVRCNIAPFIWPVEFDQQADAIKVQVGWGIEGYTGVYQIKH